MTATITPDGSPDLVRTDPTTRLGDYARALSFYLKFIDRPLFGIVFVENSNSDLGTLRALVEARDSSARVEFIGNYGVHTYSARGRAYGEYKLLDYAMEHSSMVRQGDIIWKVTGRYIVKNLPRMICSAPYFDIYCDMKDHPLRWMDMRIAAWKPRVYDLVFRGLADELCEQMGERTMRDFLPQRVATLASCGQKINFVQRFRTEPLVDGIRGYDNQNYSLGRNLFKFYVRTLGRTIIPWYWI